jgi:hypothetical protein
VANKVNNPNSQDAYVYATVAVATVKLELKDLEGARKDLDYSEKILDGFDSVETIVHAAFYRVNATVAVQTRVRLLLQKCPSLPGLHRPERLNPSGKKESCLRP